MTLERGFLLYNRYRIEELIAAGGMGAIYRATDEILGVQVAIKENFFTTSESSRQFRREATILAALKHANLPRVTDHFVISEQGQYLAMDFIEGEDVKKIIENHGALPVEEVVRIASHICDALDYLHSRVPPVVHRDIKPGNIKITSNGQVFLVDFGLAKLAQGEATTTGAQGYTPGFAPPEQYAGQGTGPRSDIYALGATLYNALTGKVPEDAISLMMGTVELTPIRKFNPNVSDSVARVIERAMSSRIEDRYPDARAFKQALLAAFPTGAQPAPELENEPQPESPAQEATRLASNRKGQTVQSHVQNEAVTQAAENGNVLNSSHETLIASTPPLPAPRKRFAWGWLVGVLALLGAAAVAIVWISGGMNPLAFTPSVTAAVTQSESASPAPSSTLMPTQTASQAAAELPNPTQTPEDTPTSTATSLPSDTPAPSQTPTPEASPTPAVTPLGGLGRIAFASNRSGIPQIWSMNADGSDVKPVTNVADGACQPDWSPDNTRLVFVSPCSGKKDTYPGSSLFIIRSDGTGLTPLATLPGGDFDPAWSPDGSLIAFTSLRDGKNQIYLYNLTDNSAKRISRPVNTERRPAWSADGKRLAYETLRTGQPQIWTLDMTAADPSATAKEFSKTGVFSYMPAWSPDGSIVIYSQGSSLSQFVLIARQVDNPQANEFKLNDKITSVENARFSPDGWWLVFSLTQGGNTDIYRMQRNGSDLTRLTEDEGLDFHPVWKP